jgi:hypothetical protein
MGLCNILIILRLEISRTMIYKYLEFFNEWERRGVYIMFIDQTELRIQFRSSDELERHKSVISNMGNN